MKSKQHSGGYSPSFRKLAIDLYLEGKTFKEVEDELGVSDSTINDWVRAAGIRHHKRKPHPLTRAILEAYAVGHGSSTIGRLFDIPERTVTSVLRRTNATRDKSLMAHLRTTSQPPPDQDELLAMARTRFGHLQSVTDVIENKEGRCL